MNDNVLDMIWREYLAYKQANHGADPSIFVVHPVLMEEAKRIMYLKAPNSVVHDDRTAPNGIRFCGVRVLRSLDIKTEEIVCA